MTPTQRSQPFPNASETFKRLNPHIFGVGAVSATKPEQNPRTLHAVPAGEGAGKRSVEEIVPRTGKPRPVARITLIACRNRELDDDNLTASLKFLRDAVADSLLPGMHAGRADAFFVWECSQVETRGREGTIIKIEV